MKRKTTVIIISALLTCCLLIGGIYAFFSDAIVEQVDLEAGTLIVTLVEDEPFDGGTAIPPEGADTNEKVFQARSDGKTSAYVRVYLVPIVEYFDTTEDTWVVANVPDGDIELIIDAPDWIESAGYYYYKSILAPTDISSPFHVTANVSTSETFESERVRVTIKVVLEAAQVSNDAWKDIFGISSLPSGVN